MHCSNLTSSGYISGIKSVTGKTITRSVRIYWGYWDIHVLFTFSFQYVVELISLKGMTSWAKCSLPVFREKR